MPTLPRISELDSTITRDRSECLPALNLVAPPSESERNTIQQNDNNPLLTARSDAPDNRQVKLPLLASPPTVAFAQPWSHDKATSPVPASHVSFDRSERDARHGRSIMLATSAPHHVSLPQLLSPLMSPSPSSSSKRAAEAPRDASQSPHKALSASTGGEPLAPLSPHHGQHQRRPPPLLLPLPPPSLDFHPCRDAPSPLRSRYFSQESSYGRPAPLAPTRDSLLDINSAAVAADPSPHGGSGAAQRFKYSSSTSVTAHPHIADIAAAQIPVQDPTGYRRPAQNPFSDSSSGNVDAPPISPENTPRVSQFRVSHKIAERRRRREMKSLFDTLRSCLPVEPGIRLSKWETLTKAIELIRQQREEINRLQCSLAVSAAVPATTPSMVGSRPPPTLYPHSSDMLPPG